MEASAAARSPVSACWLDEVVQRRGEVGEVGGRVGLGEPAADVDGFGDGLQCARAVPDVPEPVGQVGLPRRMPRPALDISGVRGSGGRVRRTAASASPLRVV